MPVKIILIPIAFLIAIYSPTNYFFNNQYDDSYITYRYAINFAESFQLVFNIGELTDSASSFAYSILLAFLYYLGAHNLEFTGAAIGVLSLTCLLLLVYKLAYLLSGNKQISAFVAVTCGFNGMLSGWSLSGMETLPWALIVLLAIYLMATSSSATKICLTLALAILIRFEGIILLISYFFYSISKKKFIYFLIIFLLLIIFTSFYLIKNQYYGVWISHAFQMKELADYYKPNPLQITRHWAIFCSIPLILSIPSFFNKQFFHIGVYVFVSFISLLIGPNSDWSRYSVHLLPIIYSFSAPTLTRLLSNRFFFKLVTITMLIQALYASAIMWKSNMNLADHQICRKKIGEYINENLPNEKHIASSDIGAISYIAINTKFVDLMALTSSDVLNSYKSGGGADLILRQKEVKYIADTLGEPPSNRLDGISTQFPSIKYSQPVKIDEIYVYSCKTRGLTFGVSKIFIQD
jgi:hypothetical protein